jgi:DNA-binding transcriptional MerR regulator
VPDSGLLLIGPFSRASCLSVKTLRAYHEAGLLVPAVVDSRTGYRSYSIAQLTDAAVIRRLRALDVPLEAIGQILEARNRETTKKVLREHGAVLEERLIATRRAVDELYAALEAPASHTPVHVRHEPARSALTLSETVRDGESFLRRAAVVLEDAVRGSGAVASGGLGALFPAQMRSQQWLER